MRFFILLCFFFFFFVTTTSAQSIDATAQCYGEAQTFETSSTGSTASQTYIVQYPQATSGSKYTCTLSCSTTTGTAYIQGVVTSADTINSSSEGTINEVTSGGCSGDLTIEVTADRNDNLLVAANCADGCTSATMNCAESCGTRITPATIVSSTFARLDSIFNYFDGHNRGRKLLLKKDEKDVDKEKYKLIRGGN